MSNLLFVYGTLLAVAQHPMGDLLRAKAVPLGAGSIRARLYVIDDPDDPGQNSYPGAVPSADPADRVFGEVHRITEDSVFDAFDRYEACAPGCPQPYEFLRRPVEVALETGESLWATSYLYTWDVTAARHVPGGRFTEVAPDVR